MYSVFSDTNKFLLGLIDAWASFRPASGRKNRLVAGVVERYKQHPTPLKPIGPRGGTKHEAFIVHHQGAAYKVRHCRSIRKAKKIRCWMDYLERTDASVFINKLHGRQADILVKSFVPGRQLLAFDEEEPEIVRKLGQLVGTTHGLRPPLWVTKSTAKKQEANFRRHLGVESLPPQLANDIEQTYRMNRPDRFQFAVTYSSAKSPSNFVVTNEGNLIVIDHENWTYDLPLSEVVILFLERFDSGRKQAFLDGYESTGRTLSAVGDQLIITELVCLLRRYPYLAKLGENTSLIECRIRALVSGQPSIFSS